MALKKEIERKFLVRRELLPELPPGRRLAQGYLTFQPTVRVRTEKGPGEERRAFLTIKGSGGIARDEFEYEIPFEEAEQMLTLALASVVTKTRYEFPVEDDPELKWELDIFDGDNQGLIVAELEMPAEDHLHHKPDWLAEDVTNDSSYKNTQLAQRPFKDW
ncbi:MAG: CYTH domain-containing protein [Actinomycetota bacterium]